MKLALLLLYFCTLSLFSSIAQAASVSDEFNRADGGLGGNWTFVASGTSAACQIVSNRIRTQASADVCFEVWTANTFANDQWAQIGIVDFTAPDSVQVGLILRAAEPPTDTWYRIAARHNAADSTKIFRYNAGVTTTVSTENAVTWISGDVLYAQMLGTEIIVKRNGGAILTTTDANLAAGRIGLMMVEGAVAGNTLADSFSGGDLAVAGARRRVAAVRFQ